MAKRLIGIIALAAITLAAAPACAQTLNTLECTSANIASTAEAISRMKDGRQKSTASDEIGAASEAMAQGKVQECKDHLLKASLQTK